MLWMTAPLLLCGLLWLLDSEFLPVGIVFSAFFALIAWITAITAEEKLFIIPAKKYNEACDPEPLLAEATEQLGYTKETRKSRRFVLSLYQAMALEAMGRRDEAEKILSGLSAEGAAVIPDIKVNYYCMRVELSARKKNVEAAKVYLGSAKENQALVKNAKRFASLQITVACSEATIVAEEGRFADANALLAPLKVTQLCQQIGVAMLSGEIALGEGRQEEAKAHFHFVARNGGKFHSVRRAEAYLRRLECPSV